MLCSICLLPLDVLLRLGLVGRVHTSRSLCYLQSLSPKGSGGRHGRLSRRAHFPPVGQQPQLGWSRRRAPLRDRLVPRPLQRLEHPQGENCCSWLFLMYHFLLDLLSLITIRARALCIAHNFGAQVMDRIKPGAVPWKKTHAKPRGRIHVVDNCNQVVTVGRTMGLTLVNIGGMDIAGRRACECWSPLSVWPLLSCAFSLERTSNFYPVYVPLPFSHSRRF